MLVNSNKTVRTVSLQQMAQMVLIARVGLLMRLKAYGSPRLVTGLASHLYTDKLCSCSHNAESLPG